MDFKGCRLILILQRPGSGHESGPIQDPIRDPIHEEIGQTPPVSGTQISAASFLQLFVTLPAKFMLARRFEWSAIRAVAGGLP